jgi:glycosyltransferase involved in cell wall biosynthesis
MSAQGRRGVRHVAVVVPARDEAALLPQCLDGIREAIEFVDVPVTVAVALDSCTDRSGEVARQHGVLVTHTSAGAVGAARRVGVDAALRTIPHTLAREEVWIANTDADSCPDPLWLRAQLDHARDGAEVVVGLVEIADWRGWPPALQERYRADYQSGFRVGQHGHVHGASLGIRADSYLAVGGFAPLRTGEDVDLVRRCVDARMAVTWALDTTVTTSARATGRAPRGLAGHLTLLSQSRIPSARATDSPSTDQTSSKKSSST